MIRSLSILDTCNPCYFEADQRPSGGKKYE